MNQPEKEINMSRKSMLYCVRTGIVTIIFTIGFFCGSLTQRNASADWGQVGGALLDQVGETGGAAGSIVQLGKTITDMEKNVSGLQQNIDTLKKVKTALGVKK